MSKTSPYSGHRRPQRKTRREMVLAAAAAAGQPRNFAVCAHSLDIDMNVQLIYRNLACFHGKEMFIVGSRNWFRGATNGVEDIIPITYSKTPSEGLAQIRDAGYSPVAVELSSRSVSVYDAVYPENPCFIVGNETYGLTEDIILSSDLVVQIPMDGVHPCLNVAMSSGVVIYDYLSKARQYL